jgi:hypothetical protein
MKIILKKNVVIFWLLVWVEDEKHLLFICPNIQKVKERFCSTLPFTHLSTLAELMQTTNMVTLVKFVACRQYPRTICPPWSTFCLMDSLIPNEHKIVNNKQFKISMIFFLKKICWVFTEKKRKVLVFFSVN